MATAVFINKVDNANVYIDGNNFLGKAKSVKLPEFEIKTSDHTNLGMIGTVSLPNGVNALEGEIVWDGFYPEVMARASDPYKMQQLMVRANASIYNAAGRVAEVPLVMIMTVNFTKIPMGDFKPQEDAEYPMSYKVHSISQLIDGKEVLFFNAFTNEYRAGGSDLLGKYRSNIGQ